MAELSPAAQAVRQAANNVFDRAGTTEQGIAAALRAAADQVAPHSNSEHLNDAGTERQEVRSELLAIAAELEGQ